MNFTELVENRKEKNDRMRTYIQDFYNLYNSFFQTDYTYNDEEAVEELGVESELIHQLLEDFAIQIIESNVMQRREIAHLKEDKLNAKELDFTSFRNEVHKNLGVSRNLRVKDAVTVLTELMIATDFDRIELLLEVFEACALKLKPLQAYEATLLKRKVI